VLKAENQPDAELGIVITGQAKIQELNKRYLGEDRPTDVLAFALKGTPSEMPSPPPMTTSTPGRIGHLGGAGGHPGQSAPPLLDREIAVLLVHGVLHLAGYDHGEPDEEKAMKARARAILAQIPGKTP